MNSDLLEYYATAGVVTSVRAFGPQVDALSDDVAELARAVQTLLVHRFWAPAYKVEVTPERDKEQGLHGAEAMLARAIELDASATVGEMRRPDRRVIGICRHF